MTEVEPQLPHELQRLASLVEEHPESLVLGSHDIREAALAATQFVFNLALQSEASSQAPITELLASFSPAEAPQTRSQSRANGKRKRSPSPSKKPTLEITPLASLFVDGMDDEQVWAQLELRAKGVCQTLEQALEGAGEEMEEVSEDEAKRRRLEDLEGDLGEGLLGEDEDLDLDEDEDEDEDEHYERQYDEDEDMEEDDGLGEEEDLAEGTSTTLLRDADDSFEEEDDDDDDEVAPEPSSSRSAMKLPKPSSKGHSELDDGFFDLAAFNAETEEAEARSVSRGSLAQDSDEDEDDNDEVVDFFAPVDSHDMVIGPAPGEEGEATYKDFFAPPPPASRAKGKAAAGPLKRQIKVRFNDEVKVKNIKASGRSLPVSTMSLLADEGDEDEDEEEEEEEFEEEDDDDDDEGLDKAGEGFPFDDEDYDMDAQSEGGQFGSRETITRLKDDLFANDEEEQPTDVSSHQRRQAQLQEQIAALEAENVAKKDWTMLGEATSKSRPQNSLLEEDMEFERVMKAIPVVTEQVVEGLEERIKARIQEGRFDDVVRRRAVDDKPFLPSRVFELQDSKSNRSLAQIYEDEYTAAQMGGVAGEDRDGKLKKQHEEIEGIWDSIASKLDALSNTHFTPKQPKATIATVSNVASASLESALPTSHSAASMLAPEEVFDPSSAETRVRGELTPAEKKALHNKQKKAKRKARDTLDSSVDKFAKSRSVKKQKEAALKGVVKAGKGVTVIGKKNVDKASRGGKKGRR